ncbi:carboxypeptidase-like regulatory domain-containing protein [Rufibacter glacialis]|nr:carboxypeptidase-like regulatory domain-containing protein [Rufibacter glacialis]
MTPQNQSRFCQNCQKPVVDFTAMSDEEVVNRLAKEHTCGRFRSTQLNRELTAFPVPQRKWAWRPVLLGLFAWFSSKAAEAQTVKKGETIKVASNASVPSVTTTTQPAPISLKGIVLDSATQAPIIGASIQLAGTSLTTISNMQGQFELTIPASMMQAKGGTPLVIFSYIGMVSERKRLDALAANLTNKILLRPDRTPRETVTITLGMPTLQPTPTKN